MAEHTAAQAATSSICDACDGEDQKLHEPLKFSGRYREWLCAVCRSALLSSDAEHCVQLGRQNVRPLRPAVPADQPGAGFAAAG